MCWSVTDVTDDGDGDEEGVIWPSEPSLLLLLDLQKCLPSEDLKVVNNSSPLRPLFKHLVMEGEPSCLTEILSKSASLKTLQQTPSCISSLRNTTLSL